MVSWYDDGHLLRNLDTDFAYPRTLQELQTESYLKSRSADGVQFSIRTIADDSLIGFDYSIQLNGIIKQDKLQSVSAIDEIDIRDTEQRS